MLLKYIFCEFDGEEVRWIHLIYYFNQNKKKQNKWCLFAVSNVILNK